MVCLQIKETIMEMDTDQGEDWRTQVPERFRSLPDQITVTDISDIFWFSKEYVRRLRLVRLHEDERGNTGPLVNALPKALGVFRRPLYWNTREIIEWGLQTGRLDPTSGEPRRLPSPGRPPRKTKK